MKVPKYFEKSHDAEEWIEKNLIQDVKMSGDGYRISLYINEKRSGLYLSRNRTKSSENLTVIFNVSSSFLDYKERNEISRGHLKVSALNKEKLVKKIDQIKERAEQRIKTAKAVDDYRSDNAEFATEFWKKIDPSVTLEQDKFGWFKAVKNLHVISKFCVKKDQQTGVRSIESMSINFHLPTEEAVKIIKNELRRLETENA